MSLSNVTMYVNNEGPHQDSDLAGLGGPGDGNAALRRPSHSAHRILGCEEVIQHQHVTFITRIPLLTQTQSLALSRGSGCWAGPKG